MVSSSCTRLARSSLLLDEVACWGTADCWGALLCGDAPTSRSRRLAGSWARVWESSPGDRWSDSARVTAATVVPTSSAGTAASWLNRITYPSGPNFDGTRVGSHPS